MKKASPECIQETSLLERRITASVPKTWSLEVKTQTADARAVPIDLLRILAASTIFYFHSGQVAGWPLYKYGEFAVASFIYLASFCTLRYSKSPTGKMPSFWWGRFRAIYPTFAIISVIIFAVSFLFAPPKIGSHYTFGDLAANLILISQYIGKPWMTASMWFIPFVLQVYLILPFFAAYPIRLSALPIIFVVSETACAMAYLLNPGLTEHSYNICRNWSPLFRLSEVYLGCLLARSRNLPEAIKYILVYVVICVFCASLAKFFPQASSTLFLPLRGILVFVILAAMAAALVPVAKNVSPRIIGILGRASFPFFLLHAPGIVFMSNLIGSSPLPWILYFVACWIGSVIFILALEKVPKRRTESGANVDKSIH